MDRGENDGVPKKDLIYNIDELEAKAGPLLIAALLIASAVLMGLGIAGLILASRWACSVIQ